MNADRRQPSRRSFLGSLGGFLSAAAWDHLVGDQQLSGDERSTPPHSPGVPHFQPRAKRVIFLHQSGAPSQLDLFDPKPRIAALHGQELPASVRQGQRLTTMTADQESKPLAASPFAFSRHGASGAELSELLPHTARAADELCIIRSMYTEAINHDPAITLFQTGAEQPGRPSMGAWVTYALGSVNEDLPAFVVMLSGGVPGDQPLFGRLWDSGFLPARHRAVRFRNQGDPLLYLSNPPGIDPASRRRMLDALAELNLSHSRWHGTDEAPASLRQFELAGRLQTSVPELIDLADESQQTFELYGPASRTRGTYAANCLLARRLVERGVRFVQLYHRGWDHHTSIESRLRGKCLETDQATAALIGDLRQRGLLDETLVVWAGEFGRTAYCQGQVSRHDYGRDHHPRCFTVWLAGGGVRAGFSYGQTDEFSYNITEHPLHVHDLQATLLHCLGIDHERLTYRFQSRDHRLTDIGGRVVEAILS